MVKNTVTLGRDEHLFGDTLTACEAGYVSGETPDGAFRAEVKIRNTQKPQPCTVIPIDETHFRVNFDTPQRAISRGQSAVIYDGDTVIGGGIIEVL